MESLIDEGSKTFEITKTPSSTSDDIAASMIISPASPIGGAQAYKNCLELLLIDILRELSHKNGAQVFISMNDFHQYQIYKSDCINKQYLTDSTLRFREPTKCRPLKLE